MLSSFNNALNITSLTSLARDDREHVKGREHLLLALARPLTCLRAFNVITKTCLIANRTPPTSATFYKAATLLSAASLVNYTGCIKNTVFNTACDHANKLLYVISLVSVCVMARFGKYTDALLATAFMSYACAVQLNAIDKKIQNKVTPCLKLLVSISMLFNANKWIRRIGAYEVFDTALNLAVKDALPILPEPIKTLPQNELSEEEINAILSGRAKLTQNPAHLNYRVLSHLPQEYRNLSLEDIQAKLLNAFGNITWTEPRKKLLQTKFGDDDRAKELLEHHDHETSLAFAKASLINACDSLKTEDAKWLDCLKRIVYAMDQGYKHSFDILIRLCVEGGGYCKLGVYAAIRNAYVECTLQNKNVSLQDRLCLILELLRHQIFDQTYSQWIKNWPIWLQKFMQRAHIKTLFLMHEGSYFGLTDQGAADHYLNSSTAVDKLLFMITSKGASRPLQALYHTYHQIDHLNTYFSHKESRLPLSPSIIYEALKSIDSEGLNINHDEGTYTFHRTPLYLTKNLSSVIWKLLLVKEGICNIESIDAPDTGERKE